MGDDPPQNIDYRLFEKPLSREVIQWMVDVNQVLFPFNETVEQLAPLFEKSEKSLICLVFQGSKPVGFKAGFEDHHHAFESWRGGVLVESRRLGIAAELMRLQHDWCRERGFRVIKTVTNSDNSAMMILNLQHGFEIVGSFVNQNKRLKILQEKRLDKPA